MCPARDRELVLVQTSKEVGSGEVFATNLAEMDIYAAAGVHYDVLDAGKRTAVAAALATTSYANQRGVVGIDQSRGEPAFVFELAGQRLAIVLECLGTKSTVARQNQEQTGSNRFADIGYDSVAAIVNDLICVGALPVVVNAYFATGSPDWYQANGRFEALIEGWQIACHASGAMWGGGESPGLSGIVSDTEIDLAGSAVGVIPSGVDPIFGEQLQAGNEIVLIASNGLHTNGASLVRKVAQDLPDGYATKLNSGKTFGDVVLAPSAIYTDVVESLLQERTPITYLSHITGHGFRKLMRADRDFTYRIHTLPPVPEVLQFLADKAGMTVADSYGTFNMGAGFAVYCAAGSGQDVVRLAGSCGHSAWVAGIVEEGPRQVVIDPVGVTYTTEDLQLR